MPKDPDKPADISQAVLYGDELIEPAREAGPESPNILMIFSDEHHWGYSGFNGHPIARTPNLDRLARLGVNFTNAYCNSPLCSPSRQSFMAGQYPHKIGAWNNCCAMPENTVTWAHALGVAGNPAYALNERALRDRILASWEPAAIERTVLKTQARQKIARCRNVCRDRGW
jgi:hypothetical protein